MTDTLRREIASVNAEEALLGACLHNRPRALAALNRLDRNDFTDARTGLVYEAISAQRAQGTGIAPALVLEHLLFGGSDGPRFGDVPGPGPYLAELLRLECPPGTEDAHANVVLRSTARRRVQEMTDRIGQAAERMPLGRLEDLLNEEVAWVQKALGRVVS